MSEDDFKHLRLEVLLRPYDKTYTAKLDNTARPIRKQYPPLPRGVFVGIGISGGGSRAANFSAAALQQLDQLGFLSYVTAISSVSGGSLTAAYYGLHHNDARAGLWADLKKLLRTDFFGMWLARYLLDPWNILRYWFTDFDRSDIMAGVFNKVLYHGKTFVEFGEGYPDILINATDLSTGDRFVFTHDAFVFRRSDIASYPVAYAVMASGAFPGIFNSVTLRDYSYDKNAYTHLIDGGPSDNLGIDTLLDSLQKTAPPVGGCFVFLIDAYNQAENARAVFKRDTRRSIDFIFDRNALDAVTSMLQNRRWSTLARLNLLRELRGHPVERRSAAYSSFQPFAGSRLQCVVWHLNFQRLEELAQEKLNVNLRKAINEQTALKSTTKHIDENYYSEALQRLVLSIETHYKLTSSERCSAELAQDALFEAARILVTEDRENLDKARAWFNGHALPVPNEREQGAPPRLPIYLDVNRNLQCVNAGEEQDIRPPPLRAEPLRRPPQLQ